MPFPLFVFAAFVVAAGTAGVTAALARQRQRAAIAAAAGAGGLLLAHSLAFFRQFVDDSYITLRYSRHLADGIGPVWNPGDHVEGYTSFSWMAILAGMAKLGFDLVLADRLLAIVLIGVTFFILYRLWSLWSREEPNSGIAHPLVFAAALLAVALVDAVSYWGLSGMETPLFMALISASALLYLQERRNGGFPWSAVAAAATAMTRPEGILVAAVTGLFVAADTLAAPDRSRALMRAGLWAMLFVLPYVTYFGWRWSYYGYFFPNTFYAKVGPSSEVFDRGLSYVVSATLNYQLLPMYGGFALLFARPRLRWDAAYLFALTGALLLSIVFEGGDGFAHGRFIAPLLPLIYLAGFAGLATALRSLSLQPLQNALVLALVLGSGGLLLLRGSNNPHTSFDRQVQQQRNAIGAWMNEHTPDDFTIAAFAVGGVAYYAHDRNVLDMLGLNDEVIAHSEVPNFGRGIPGHEKYNIDYVLDVVRPQIIIYAGADVIPRTSAEVRARAATSPSLLAADNALMNDPRLWDRYDVRSLYLDNAWYNFLQRKDTFAELQAPGLQ